MNDVYSIYPVRPACKNNKYKKHINILSDNSLLKPLIDLVGPLKYEIPIWSSIEDTILYTVIGQMLSNSASLSIIRRLHRNLGSSSAVFQWAKRNYHRSGPIRGVSQKKRKTLYQWLLYANSHPGVWEKWKHLPLAEYRREISNIWGFGRWSADMIAIFHLGRMDIWPETDNGIKKASCLIFGTERYGMIKRHIAGCETITALYFWELLNKNLVSHFKGNRHG